jgi:hypothetical protein
VQQGHGLTERVVQAQPTIAHVLPPFIESLALPTRCSWPTTHDSTSAASPERCAITIVYVRGSPRPAPRTMTPRVVLEVNGVRVRDHVLPPE